MSWQDGNLPTDDGKPAQNGKKRGKKMKNYIEMNFTVYSTYEENAIDTAIDYANIFGNCKVVNKTHGFGCRYNVIIEEKIYHLIKNVLKELPLE